MKGFLLRSVAPLQLDMDIWIYGLHPYLNVLALMQHPWKEDKSDYWRLFEAPAIRLSANLGTLLDATRVCGANIAPRPCLINHVLCLYLRFRPKLYLILGFRPK